MDLFNIRKDFTLQTLNEEDALSNPIEMLQLWLNQAIQAEALEPTAMTLSTATMDGKPSSRVVLVKEIREEGSVFFSNYKSKKGLQIADNNNVAINFMWHELERQIRIEGKTKRLPEEESDKYFDMRPLESRIGAWASPQSQVISGRTELEEAVNSYQIQFERSMPSRPPQWGGYIIIPSYFEFWQGRQNRLHDRIQYTQKVNKTWKIERLAP